MNNKPSVRAEDLPYRPCVGIMVLNRDGLVFIGRRRSEAGPEHVGGGYAWQMPQGGIDPGENPYRAALRELYEETNVRSVSLLAEAPDWYAYDLPASVAPFILRGVALLGIDSVMAPKALRQEAWTRLARDLDRSKLASMTRTIKLDDVIEAGREIIDGKVRGRIETREPNNGGCHGEESS